MPKQPVRLRLAATGNGPDTLIEVDGKDITARASSVTLEAQPRELTRLFVVYNCLEGVEVEGEMTVHHVCPLEEKTQ